MNRTQFIESHLDKNMSEAVEWYMRHWAALQWEWHYGRLTNVSRK